MFTDQDIEQIEKLGIPLPEIERQIKIFRKGFPFMKLIKPATIGDGIVRMTEPQIEEASLFYHRRIKNNLQPLKFVPASGAASRMFQSLYSFRENLNQGGLPEELLSEDRYKGVRQFFDQIEDFAFFDELNRGTGGIKDNSGRINYQETLDYIFSEEGLNYGFLPKGLLKFHEYPGGSRTPVEEQMVEGALYGANSKREVNIHFTVSPEHLKFFREKTAEAARLFEPVYEVKYLISFSEQKPSTDTIAVDLENNPFHNPDGSLLFRPAGHGALLDNLNELKTDVIFIKNIDNIVPDNLKRETVRYKIALAGRLLQYQEKISGYLRILEKDPAVITDEQFNEMAAFAENDLCNKPLEEVKSSKTTVALFLRKKFNRPLRICGMVRNLGEPGGGPFWAEDADGTISLQIVESPQINMKDTEQEKIAASATHFNPVDIICAVYDYKGRKFDLKQFTDPETGFISHKSKDGKPLKALELPGLWNGSMSDWNTVFVDVPVITFNPVKTVNDLLRKEHQPELRVIKKSSFIP